MPKGDLHLPSAEAPSRRSAEVDQPCQSSRTTTHTIVAAAVAAAYELQATRARHSHRPAHHRGLHTSVVGHEF